MTSFFGITQRKRFHLDFNHYFQFINEGHTVKILDIAQDKKFSYFTFPHTAFLT